jgi:hypothetical protein
MMPMARTLTTRVVLKDGTLYEWATEDKIATYFQSFLAYIRLLHTIADNESGGGLTTQQLSEYDDSWKLFEYIMGNCCYRRKFFRTKNGSLGLGPACLTDISASTKKLRKESTADAGSVLSLYRQLFWLINI